MRPQANGPHFCCHCLAFARYVPEGWGRCHKCDRSIHQFGWLCCHALATSGSTVSFNLITWWDWHAAFYYGFVSGATTLPTPGCATITGSAAFAWASVDARLLCARFRGPPCVGNGRPRLGQRTRDTHTKQSTSGHTTALWQLPQFQTRYVVFLPTWCCCTVYRCQHSQPTLLRDQNQGHLHAERPILSALHQLCYTTWSVCETHRLILVVHEQQPPLVWVVLLHTFSPILLWEHQVGFHSIRAGTCVAMLVLVPLGMHQSHQLSPASFFQHDCLAKQVPPWLVPVETDHWW